MDEKIAKPTPPVEQVCSMRIVFPITTDEKAIEIKKLIDNALLNIPNAQMHFSIMPKPPVNPYGSSIR